MLVHIRKTGEYFHGKLKGLKAKHACVQEIRGMGLMLGMDLDSADRAKAVVSQLLAGGILINRTQDTVLRFLPPYIIQRTHVDQVIRALDSALTSSEPKKADQQREADKKEPIKVSSQPQATQVVPPPATTTFPGPRSDFYPRPQPDRG